MKNVVLALLLSGCAGFLYPQGAPPQGTADQPYTMEYYYKVQWGHQQEFLQLFLKNHYPLLRIPAHCSDGIVNRLVVPPGLTHSLNIFCCNSRQVARNPRDEP